MFFKDYLIFFTIINNNDKNSFSHFLLSILSVYKCSLLLNVIIYLYLAIYKLKCLISFAYFTYLKFNKYG